MKRSPYEWAGIVAIYLVILIVTGFFGALVVGFWRVMLGIS